MSETPKTGFLATRPICRPPDNLIPILIKKYAYGAQKNHHNEMFPLSTVKPVLSGHSKEDQKLVFKTDYRLMQVESIAEYSPLLFKTFVFSLFKQGLSIQMYRKTLI